MPLAAGDIDLDNDIDIVIRGVGEVSWIENIDGQGSFGDQHIFDTNALYGGIVTTGDVDDDGDLDILSGSQVISNIKLYRNSTTLGFDDLDFSNSINIYPNPSTKILNIDFGRNKYFDYSIFIYDLSGRKILEKAFVNRSKCKLDVSQFLKGFYIIDIITSSDRFSKKIIID